MRCDCVICACASAEDCSDACGDQGACITDQDGSNHCLCDEASYQDTVSGLCDIKRGKLIGNNNSLPLGLKHILNIFRRYIDIWVKIVFIYIHQS